MNHVNSFNDGNLKESIEIILSEIVKSKNVDVKSIIIERGLYDQSFEDSIELDGSKKYKEDGNIVISIHCYNRFIK